MDPSLRLRNIGQIKEADLTFGDLTVLVGPQASGKSIALQWLKLVLDTGHVQSQLTQYGLDWNKALLEFIELNNTWRHTFEKLQIVPGVRL